MSRKQRAAPKRVAGKRPLSRQQRRRRKQRLTLIFGIIAVAVILVLVACGFIVG